VNVNYDELLEAALGTDVDLKDDEIHAPVGARVDGETNWANSKPDILDLDWNL
jgi:hypothetical protein